MAASGDDNGSQGISAPDATEVNIPVYRERTVITVQPRPAEIPGSRHPLPVITDAWQATSFGQLVPLSGLDFLTGIREVVIQQTVELEDIIAAVESENRFLVRDSAGHTLYVACETSSAAQRRLCAAARAFSITLFDVSGQAALCLRRPLACSSACCCCGCGCCLQELQVYFQSGQRIGIVKQEWSPLIPSFVILNNNEHILYRIEGPSNAALALKGEAGFKILSQDGTTQYGSIQNAWNNQISTYNIVITFPSRTVDPQLKALIISAGFLLEYMFFETTKRAKLFFCC